MAAPYQACALYQQLVKHLQQCMAEEIATLRGSTVKEESKHIDHIIRDWFFTPQHDLHGSSPREVIRREELDEPNLLPPPSPDDDELIQELHEIEELLGGEPHHWYVDDGGLSLLDEYDSEGQDEYFRRMDERAAAHRAEEELLGEPPDEDDLPFSRN
jgi:hypothetical protein